MLVQAILFNGQICCIKNDAVITGVLPRKTAYKIFPREVSRMHSGEEKKKRSKVLGFYSKSLENSTCSFLHLYSWHSFGPHYWRSLIHQTNLCSEINLNFFPGLLILTVKILVLEAAGAAARLGCRKPPGDRTSTEHLQYPHGNSCVSSTCSMKLNPLWY